MIYIAMLYSLFLCRSDVNWCIEFNSQMWAYQQEKKNMGEVIIQISSTELLKTIIFVEYKIC
jgi:hypothetical protein